MVEIHEKQQLLLSSDASVFRQQLSTVLDCMREELDDHRLSINENMSELGSAYELVGEMNRRLDKLTERLDSLTLHLMGHKAGSEFKVEALSSREKEVFLALYSLTESQPFASYEQIARKCMLPKESVVSYVASMIQKGVPVQKKLDGNSVFLKLDAAFRIVQAKRNLVGLPAPLTCWIR